MGIVHQPYLGRIPEKSPMQEPDQQKYYNMIRTRPGMFFGSTRYGIEKFVYDLVANILYVLGQSTFGFNA